MPEPVKTQPNPAGTGRPIISDEQYAEWLNDMRDFLRRGCTLFYAIDKADLFKHKDSIYEKYKSNDPGDVWFSEKIDRLRATLGEMTNDLAFKVVERAKSRMVEDNVAQLTDNEVKIVKLVAERHRTAQPFFVNRTETAVADDSKLGKIVESLDTGTDYDELANEAAKQMVASNPSVQDKEQGRPAGGVQAEHSPAQAPIGAGQPPV